MLNTVARDFIPQADCFAVVTGPGSWTGSRVGVVAVKAWAFATGKPIIALTANSIDENLINAARQKLKQKDFTSIRELAPHYDSEFKVT